MKKILILANGTIGDIVTAMPAMKRICDVHRDDKVHLYNTRIVKNDIHKTLFEHLDWFDRMTFKVVPDSLLKAPWKRFANWYSIRREHYDIIYELPGNFLMPKFMLNAFGAGIIYSPEKIDPKGKPRHRYLLDFLTDCGIPRYPSDEPLDWNFQPEEISAANQWLKKIQIPTNAQPFVLCTGGKSPVQHWHLERYADVLKRIISEKKLFPVIVGSSGDAPDAEFLLKKCGTGVFSQEIGPISLREMIIVFRNFKFYLGNDTGILHLAGAAGIPCIGISSARAPENYWTPLGESHEIITADVPCKDCRANKCPYNNDIPNCLEKIDVSAVIQRIETVLSR